MLANLSEKTLSTSQQVRRIRPSPFQVTEAYDLVNTGKPRVLLDPTTVRRLLIRTERSTQSFSVVPFLQRQES